jgi:hypothetical protein
MRIHISLTHSLFDINRSNNVKKSGKYIINQVASEAGIPASQFLDIKKSNNIKMLKNMVNI